MKLFGFLLPMTFLIGLVVALDVAVWRLSPSQAPTPNAAGERQPSTPDQEALSTQPEPHIFIGPEGDPRAIRMTKSLTEAKQEQEDREREASTQRWTVGTGVVMALFTLALIVLGALQYKTYNAQLATTKEIERAYIKMAHSPKPPAPGGNPNGGRLHFLRHPDTSPTTDVWFAYGIKNCGRTPCNVLGGGIWHVVSNDPVQEPQWMTPDDAPIRVAPTFLVPDMSVSDQQCLTLDAVVAEKISVGAARYLWLIGYVDYCDRFNRFHRAGYGRFYDHIAMDLVFDRTTAAMNYDRELKPEERKRYES